MVYIPTATWTGVCPKWILMVWCCVVLFAGQTQSVPVSGDSFNGRRSLLFMWRWASTPSPSKSPPKSPDPSGTPRSYAQSRTSSQSEGKGVPVPGTQKEETGAESDSHAFNPTSPTVSGMSWLSGISPSPSGGKGSTEDSSKPPSTPPFGFQLYPSTSAPEALGKSSEPSPISPRNATEGASGQEPSSSPGSAETKKETGNLSLQQQLAEQLHPASSSSPSPGSSTTVSPSSSSPSPTSDKSFGAVAKSISDAAEREREQKANKTTPSSPSPDMFATIAGVLASPSPSPVVPSSPSPSPVVPSSPSPSPVVPSSPSPSPSIQPEPSIPVAPSSECPEETPIESPAPVPGESPVVTPIESPAPVPSESPEEAPIETPEIVPIETPAETPVESPTTVPSESPAAGSSEYPAEASFSEILEAVSSEITEIPPTEIPEATSSEIAEPSILEIPAMLSSIAEPSFVATPPSEDLIPESVPLESPDASFTSPEPPDFEAFIPSVVALLPPVEASESGPDSSPIAASSEAPHSTLSVVVASVTGPDTSIPPETPSSETDVPPPEASIEAPLPATLPEVPTGITPAQILAQNPGVKTGVTTKEGKVGILVPKGVTITLKNVVFEIEDDVDVGIAVEAGTLDFDKVTILIKSQTASSFHRALRSTVPKTQKGLSLTNGANTKISNSTFEGGTASMVDVKDGSQFHCFGCVFKDNVGEQGGAITAKGSSVKLESCSFENNGALSGGALYILGQHFGDKFTTLTITDSVLTENKATKEGGSLFVKNVDTCLIKNSKINDGLAGTQGGGLFASSISNLQINGSEFTNNKAEASYGGAASLFFCSDIKLTETQFGSNSANDGGALAVFEKYKASGKLEISKSTFQSNEAAKRGGAILIQTRNQGEIKSSTDTYVTIYNSSFLHNIATDGGAIYAFSDSGESFNLNMGITKTRFVGNRATKSGGGMYCGRQSVIHFENSVFQSNEAHAGKGCAMYCGCSVSKGQTDSLQMQHVVEEGGSRPACTTGTAVTMSAGKPGTSNSKSNTLMYVFITLAVLAALVVVSIAVALKHKQAMQSDGSNLLRRSLSSFTGPSRLRNIMSVPFSDAAESQEDATSTTTALLRRVHDYGEMEHDIDAAANADQSEVGSIHSHFVTDEEERMAETIFADDAFAFDAFADDSNAPLLPTVSNLYQMTNDKRNE